MKTSKKEIVLFNILEVEVGTTGLRGGDAGHGGETLIRFTDHSSTAWEMLAKDYSGLYHFQDLQEFQLKLYGDSELQTFIEGLEFILSELKKSE